MNESLYGVLPSINEADEEKAVPHPGLTEDIQVDFNADEAAYLHGAISREEAERILSKRKPVRDGRFLIRLRAVEGLQYRVRAQPNGTVALLIKAPKRFSVPSSRRESLDSNTSETPTTTSALARAGSFTVAVAQLYGATAIPSRNRRASSDSVVSRGSMHSLLSVVMESSPVKGQARRSSMLGGKAPAAVSPKASLRAQAMLNQARSSVGSDDGVTSAEAATYIAMQLDDADAPVQFILSIVHKQRLSHHLLNRTAPGEPFTINKQPTPCVTLEQAVRYLSRPQGDKWPVTLTEPVAGVEDCTELHQEAKMLLGQGHYRAALHCFNKIVNNLNARMADDPDCASSIEHTLAETYNMRSFAYYGLQDYTAASADAYKASQLEPEWWRPYYSRGMALKKADDLEGAIRCYRQAINVLPKGHAREPQCERALAQAEKRLEETKQLRSLQGKQEIKAQRTCPIAKETNMKFHPDMSDLGIWFTVLRRDQSQADGCSDALRRELDERVISTQFDDDLDDESISLEQLKWEAPLPEDLAQEYRQLEELHVDSAVPRERWRVSQRQHLKTWPEWFRLRLQAALGEPPSAINVKTTEMYSWVLTAANLVETMLGDDGINDGHLTLHIVTQQPLNAFSILELAILLPNISTLDVWQTVVEQQSACLVCDHDLPGDDQLPMQHVRNVILPGTYDSVQHFMPKPDLLLVLDQNPQSNTPAITAGLEDAICDLHRRSVPVLMTQASHRGYTSIKSWVKQLLLTCAPSLTGVNPFAALRNDSEDTSDIISIGSMESSATVNSDRLAGGRANAYSVLVM
eukprot:TRINITY_DN10023_c0_g1_i1.p1 TRINITY_DN10023_c0_g1~~TRINITY_DN10023_c0_g1_i1.p1  ORF type:complete len:806 (+),score=205.32 TRINITY_DN10023_c0_g1_i1:110-2527(+)